MLQYIGMVVIAVIATLAAGSFALQITKRIECLRHGHKWNGVAFTKCERCGKRQSLVPSMILVLLGVVALGIIDLARDTKQLLAKVWGKISI